MWAFHSLEDRNAANAHSRVSSLLITSQWQVISYNCATRTAPHRRAVLLQERSEQAIDTTQGCSSCQHLNTNPVAGETTCFSVSQNKTQVN